MRHIVTTALQKVNIKIGLVETACENVNWLNRLREELNDGIL
jgi:hypothetical protein